MSIERRFRYNELFLFAGNDIIAMSDCEGATPFYIHVQLTHLLYRELFVSLLRFRALHGPKIQGRPVLRTVRPGSFVYYGVRQGPYPIRPGPASYSIL